MTVNICAMVMFYNPTSDVLSNIESYIEFIDKLYIVDNTEVQNNSDLIDSLLELYGKKIKYIKNSSNLGVAKALNIGCEEAIKNSFNWILTMDQDSSFCDFNTFLTCFKKVNKANINIAVASPDYMKNCDHENISCSYEKRDITITSGSLINLNILKKIGRFEEKLFIDEVDFEYCLRANKSGYDVICLNNIPLKHNLGEVNKKKSTKRKTRTQHNYIRRYYITRNRLYISSLYGKDFQKYQMKTVLYEELYKSVSRIIRREDNKLKKLKSVFLGIKDYLRGKYGRFEYKY